MVWSLDYRPRNASEERLWDMHSCSYPYDMRFLDICVFFLPDLVQRLTFLRDPMGKGPYCCQIYQT